MTISLVTRKALWVLSGNECAFPGCGQVLLLAPSEQGGGVLSTAGLVIGEEAHIRSPKSDGPRHDPNYADPDSFPNLVLLCPTHHTLVDKDGGVEYTVGRLEEIKQTHENFVRSRRSVGQQRDVNLELAVATEIERFGGILFGRWSNIHWALSRPIPGIREEDLDALVEAGMLLLAKEWPGAFPNLGEAAGRVRALIGFVTEHVNDCFAPMGENNRRKLDRPEKRLQRWDPTEYEHQSRFTQVNMVVSWYLADQLTAELNNWIRAVRSDFDPLYRFEEGVLLVPVGDGIVAPIAHTRIEFAPTAAPRLPNSLEDLKAAIERIATKRGVEPQQIHPCEI